ncbi:MAG: SGNH/GDSL hydrolase family protein [Ruminococcaceae bacterium]|nr:SGNH/GDSL hydrolase family protein [Oscillospiraceae bacterium]
MELKGLKINFLGDSITQGYAATDRDVLGFVGLIASRYGAVCRNYGIGGTRIAPQKEPSKEPRWDRDFIGRVDEMDPDADIVVVFGGTNDFGHGDAPLGEFSDRTADTFAGSLHVLCLKLIEKYPSAKIVVATPLHRRAEDDPTVAGRKPDGTAVFKDYVNLIRQTAEYYGLPLLDLYATSGLQPAVPIIKEKYMNDGLHPNNAGHSILADKIAAFLMYSI